MPAPVDLVVPNLGEYNLSRLGTSLGPLATRDSHQIGERYADQGILWSTRDRVLALPAGVDLHWLADLSAALGDPVPAIVTPAGRSGALTGDLLADGKAMGELATALGRPRRVELLCWGASRELYGLAAAVASLGHEVVTEMPAREHYWTSGYLDSKLSCLDLRTVLPDLRVPRSWTVAGPAELQGAVGHLLATAGQAFVKSPCGVGGEGIYRVSARDDDQAGLWSAVEESPFFGSYPLLVQEVIATRPELDTPSVDLLIGPHGVTAAITSVIAVAGRQLMTLGRGTGLLPAALEDQAHESARRIAAWAAGLGYSGWLGVDFLVGRDGSLYLLELNARRTGGVHAAALLERREDKETAVACVDDDVALPGHGPVSYSAVRGPLLAAWGEGEQVYASTVRGLRRQRSTLGLVALGADAGQAQDLLDRTSAAMPGQDRSRTRGRAS